MQFKNFKFSIKLSLLSGVMIMFILIISFVTINYMKELAKLTLNLYEHPFAVTKAILTSSNDLLKIRFHINNIIYYDEFKENISKIKEYEKSFNENIEIVEEQFLGDKKLVENIKKNFTDWKGIREEQIVFIKNNQKEKAFDIQTKAFSYVEKIDENIDKIRDFADNKAKKFMSNASMYEDRALFICYAVIFIAIASCIVIAALITKSIVPTLKKLCEIVEKVSDGNLSLDLTNIDRSDEIGILWISIVKTITYLRKQINEIKEGSNILASSSSQISSAVTQFATSATESSVSVNETMTTVEEVKQTAQISNQKAKMMSETAQKASDIAQIGQRATNESIKGMSQIKEQMHFIADSTVKLSEQTQSIGEIIATVNDLAEQSNLLAVNASIEAVKAGEAGKGFGVVAHEIRRLAEKSKQATTQVRSILNDIQKAVSTTVMATEHGAKAVSTGEAQTCQAGEAIENLYKSITNATQFAIQIAASSQQQLVGVDQVVSAMDGIKQSSLQNANGAKQLEESATNLKQLSKGLQDMVSRYIL
ncbi:MAG: methyl-accepting chemotaxis protein [Desulfobacterales bacterium]|nr:methyl-accepting chemotaxis protein [Desulfobacterales bacterium]